MTHPRSNVDRPISTWFACSRVGRSLYGLHLAFVNLDPGQSAALAVLVGSLVALVFKSAARIGNDKGERP